jgi:RimJ/RimL family protein N-acetyltransferase
LTGALETPRLRLVPATPHLIDAELDGQERLAAALGAELPVDWPPEHHDPETLRFWREQLSQPGAAGWWLYYTLLSQPVRPILVGTVSFKGPPKDGVVEVGYSVVASWQRRGLATEASRALIEAAWGYGVQLVIAHTFAHLEPSLGVLRKLGFEPAGANEAGELEFRLPRA